MSNMSQETNILDPTIPRMPWRLSLDPPCSCQSPESIVLNTGRDDPDDFITTFLSDLSVCPISLPRPHHLLLTQKLAYRFAGGIHFFFLHKSKKEKKRKMGNHFYNLTNSDLYGCVSVVHTCYGCEAASHLCKMIPSCLQSFHCSVVSTTSCELSASTASGYFETAGCNRPFPGQTFNLSKWEKHRWEQ